MINFELRLGPYNGSCDHENLRICSCDIYNFQTGIANWSILVKKRCLKAQLRSWPWEGAIQHKEFIICNFITLDSISTATTITEYCRIAYASNIFIWTKFITPYQNFLLPLSNNQRNQTFKLKNPRNDIKDGICSLLKRKTYRGVCSWIYNGVLFCLTSDRFLYFCTAAFVIKIKPCAGFRVRH